MFGLARHVHRRNRGWLSVLYMCMAVFEFGDSAFEFSRHYPIWGAIILVFGIVLGAFGGTLRAVAHED